ncbi:WYL domain-containing protein [Marinilabiliaceae bacterium ANBcel2]|nr:WYL domain-containing protein [Marinilabiliaceae bacterium ANBcel2]
MLEILLMLNCKYGRTIEELAAKYSLSQRTIYRYINTFRQVGFVVSNKYGYFKIDVQNSVASDISELLHFNEEESFLLSKAIHSIDENIEFKSKLVKKLYSIYDTNRIIYSVVKKKDTENIYNVLQAIKKQMQVVFKGYRSGNSAQIRDRVVEPFDFTENYNAIWCFDVEDESVKLFKSARIEEVVLQKITWKYKSKHVKGITDVFRISTLEKIKVELKLTLLAANLLLEEFPLSEKFLSRCNKSGYFYFCCDVAGFIGVGRFVLGLPGEVEVLSPKSFIDYIKEKQKTSLVDIS